jgi:hypothetical protein
VTSLGLLVVMTACGGVIDPPPLPTRPPTVTRVATATPGREPAHWVKNHRVTDMWSGPLGSPGVVSFGKTSSTFCSFRVEEEGTNARMRVYNPYEDGTFWIDGDAVGPVEEPQHRAGPKPAGVNCAEAVYDLAPVFAPAVITTRTPGPAQTGPATTSTTVTPTSPGTATRTPTATPTTLTTTPIPTSTR